MSTHHTHSGHGDHSHREENLSDSQLVFTVAIIVLTTLAQIVGWTVSGWVSGSVFNQAHRWRILRQFAR